jgi:hypothetical protein
MNRRAALQAAVIFRCPQFRIFEMSAKIEAVAARMAAVRRFVEPNWTSTLAKCRISSRHTQAYETDKTAQCSALRERLHFRIDQHTRGLLPGRQKSRQGL